MKKIEEFDEIIRNYMSFVVKLVQVFKNKIKKSFNSYISSYQQDI